MAGQMLLWLAALMIANDVAVQSDGKVVVVGTTPQTATTIPSFVGGNGFIIRQLGSAVPLASARKSFATDVALQRDGKIVIVGSLYASPNFDMFVARITAAGVYDTSFDGDGARGIGLGAQEFGD